jgi:hypothetical protein
MKSRFQTSFFPHRRKRLNPLFHLANSSGRSRHGVPARTSHNTASTNKRLSLPCRPLSPGLPGISDSMRCHCVQPRIDIFPDQVFIDALAQHLQAQRRDGGQLGMSGNMTVYRDSGPLCWTLKENVPSVPIPRSAGACGSL